MRPAKEVPIKGIYTKIAKTIINEFLKQNPKPQAKAIVEITKIEKDRQFVSLYNAMKSLIRRKKLKLRVSMNMKEKKLYLAKEN